MAIELFRLCCVVAVAMCGKVFHVWGGSSGWQSFVRLLLWSLVVSFCWRFVADVVFFFCWVGTLLGKGRKEWRGYGHAAVQKLAKGVQRDGGWRVVAESMVPVSFEGVRKESIRSVLVHRKGWAAELRFHAEAGRQALRSVVDLSLQERCGDVCGKCVASAVHTVEQSLVIPVAWRPPGVASAVWKEPREVYLALLGMAFFSSGGSGSMVEACFSAVDGPAVLRGIAGCDYEGGVCTYWSGDFSYSEASEDRPGEAEDCVQGVEEKEVQQECVAVEVLSPESVAISSSLQERWLKEVKRVLEKGFPLSVSEFIVRTAWLGDGIHTLDARIYLTGVPLKERQRRLEAFTRHDRQLDYVRSGPYARDVQDITDKDAERWFESRYWCDSDFRQKYIKEVWGAQLVPVSLC